MNCSYIITGEYTCTNLIEHFAKNKSKVKQTLAKPSCPEGTELALLLGSYGLNYSCKTKSGTPSKPPIYSCNQLYKLIPDNKCKSKVDNTIIDANIDCPRGFTYNSKNVECDGNGYQEPIYTCETGVSDGYNKCNH
jgi:hypothetical protein